MSVVRVKHDDKHLAYKFDEFQGNIVFLNSSNYLFSLLEYPHYRHFNPQVLGWILGASSDDVFVIQLVGTGCRFINSMHSDMKIQSLDQLGKNFKYPVQFNNDSGSKDWETKEIIISAFSGYLCKYGKEPYQKYFWYLGSDDRGVHYCQLNDDLFGRSVSLPFLKTAKLVGKNTFPFKDVEEELPITLQPICNIFSQYYDHPQYSDFTVICGGVSIPCHRFALARSPYFENLFHFSTGQQTSSVELNNFDPNVLRSILKFFYTNQLPEFTGENVVELYCISHYLQLADFAKMAELFLIKNIDSDNLDELLTMVDKYNSDSDSQVCLTMLSNKLQQFILENWKDIAKNQQIFGMLMNDHSVYMSTNIFSQLISNI